MNRDPQSYDEDFFVWTQHQATLLRDGKWDALDLLNLAEEIESLGKRDRRGLSNKGGTISWSKRSAMQKPCLIVLYPRNV